MKEDNTKTKTNSLVPLIDDLLKLGHETEWVEFKENNCSPELIGEYISALANAATIHDQEWGYLVYGISNEGLEVVGTKFDINKKVKNNQDIRNWLSTLLDPCVNIEFKDGFYRNGKKIVVLKVEQSINYPTKFKGQAYVRVGENKKPIDKAPEKQKVLWSKLNLKDFESQAALEPSSFDEAVANIGYSDIFRLLGLPLPDNKRTLITKLIELGILKKIDGLYAPTNLGALLFATDLSAFEWLSRKAIRLIIYNGRTKTSSSKEIEGQRGYALAIPGLIRYIQDNTQQQEIISAPRRESGSIYPEPALRELVINSLVHQDLSMKGSGPIFEIYSDRVVLCNPGMPIIDVHRFVDHEPISRNEKLARMLRRLKFCEERGSGIDRAVVACELNGLPAPIIRAQDYSTVVVLLAPRRLANMSKEERIWSLYIHACIQYVNNDYMTNKSVRKRFGIEDSNYPQASRLIKLVIDSGLVKEKDVNSSKKDSKYVPFWV